VGRGRGRGAHGRGRWLSRSDGGACKVARTGALVKSLTCAAALSSSSGVWNGSARTFCRTCPVSTEGWTRRVHFVREGRGGVAPNQKRTDASSSGTTEGVLSQQAAAERALPPPPSPRTRWTRRVPHPVLIGHAASRAAQRPRVGSRTSIRTAADMPRFGVVTADTGTCSGAGGLEVVCLRFVLGRGGVYVRFVLGKGGVYVRFVPRGDATQGCGGGGVQDGCRGRHARVRPSRLVSARLRATRVD